jgi:DNA-binding transcriptional ArsR family regulator
VATYEAVLDALGDRTRRQIVGCLRASPASVGELAAQLPVSRPAISQHLRILRDSDLVTFETSGTRNIYRLDRDGIEPLRSWLDGFWATVLESFAARAEEVAGDLPPQTNKALTKKKRSTAKKEQHGTQRKARS